jgi:glycolate oxidase FAD binding subunit
VSDPLEQFAAEVGPEAAGSVRVVGGRTQWEVGGLPIPGVRELAAPAGVVAHEPAEMIVRVRAGTCLDELRAAVRSGGQDVALDADDPSLATIGGILAVGHSGHRRLGLGPVRDAVLEISAVNARGQLIRSGAPLVKNVTGFDLCRLLVGSLGTLALLGEVVLRCRPLPEVETWWVADDADPFALADALYRPLSLLWDGVRTWVGLAGYQADVRGQAEAVLGPSFRAADGPPASPGAVRRSRPPGGLRSLPKEVGVDGGWLAEVGVGVVHCTPEVAARMAPGPDPAPALVGLHRALKERFDPEGRLNPGRSVLARVPS